MWNACGKLFLYNKLSERYPQCHNICTLKNIAQFITPLDLIDSLKQISHSLHKNKLPLTVYTSSIAKYIDIIELEAYQSDSKVVFVLKIPLVDPETYTLYHSYPIMIPDNRTGFQHIISTIQKYIARDDDSMSCFFTQPGQLEKFCAKQEYLLSGPSVSNRQRFYLLPTLLILLNILI